MRGLSLVAASGGHSSLLWLTGLVSPRHVGSSQTRAQTHVPCIGRRILNHCATREALDVFLIYLWGGRWSPRLTLEGPPFFLFLIHLTGSSFFKVIIRTMYWLCVYVCLYVSKMIDNNDTIDRREELEFFHYCKILTLPMMLYSVIWKWIWISYNYIATSMATTKKKFQKEV